jgi:hypothetical protein
MFDMIGISGLKARRVRLPASDGHTISVRWLRTWPTARLNRDSGGRSRSRHQSSRRCCHPGRIPLIPQSSARLATSAGSRPSGSNASKADLDWTSRIGPISRVMRAIPKQTFDVYRKEDQPEVAARRRAWRRLAGPVCFEGLDIGGGALCAALRRLGGHRHQRLRLLPARQGLESF